MSLLLDVKPEKIPVGGKRRVCMRLTTSTCFASVDRWIHLWALNGGVKVQLTLDAPENVVTKNGPDGQASQSSQFELSVAGLRWVSLPSVASCKRSVLNSWRQGAHCCTKLASSARMKFSSTQPTRTVQCNCAKARFSVKHRIQHFRSKARAG